MQLFLNPSVSYTLLWIYTHSCLISSSQIPDAHVTCTYSEDCVLPCSFTPSAGAVDLRWYRQGTLIYTFPGAEGEGEGETSAAEVSRGNASLHLRDSDVRSRGRYRCAVNSTEGLQESVVIVRVEAPISSVAIDTAPNAHVRCSSRGVYPAPVLRWSTEPASAPDSLRPTTRMSADSNQLFRVESSVRKINTSADLTYVCSINSKYDSQTWRASLLQKELIGRAGHGLVLPCIAPAHLRTFTLTWTFTRPGWSSHILTYRSDTQQTKHGWVGGAELDRDRDRVRMGNGSLHLRNVNKERCGTYTCVLTASGVNHTVQVTVMMSDFRSIAQTEKSPSGLWVLAAIVAALILLCVLFFVIRKYRDRSKHPRRSQQHDTEMQAVHGARSGENLPTEARPLSQNTTADS